MDPRMIFAGVALIGGAVWYMGNQKPDPLPETTTQSLAVKSEMVAAGARDPGKRNRNKVYDGTNPEVLRKKELAGYVYHTPALLRQDGSHAIVAEAVDGLEPARVGLTPAGLQPIEAPADCAWRIPRPGEQVAGVVTYGGGLETAVHAFSDARIAKAAMDGLIEHKKARGARVADNASIPELPKNTALRMVDVVVNLPGDPVFLALQDVYGGVLWNLLPAEGTTLAAVVVLSGGSSGVVNLPEGTVLQGQNLRRDESCSQGKHPVDPPPDAAAPREGFSFATEDVTHHRLKRYDDYGAWFEKTFGVPSGTGAAVAAGVSHVLLGAMPSGAETRVAWRGPDQGVAHVIPAELTYAATPQQHDAWVRQRGVEMLAAAFGVSPETDLGAILRAQTEERKP